MKLYDVPNNSIIRLNKQDYWFKHIDGAYSYCVQLCTVGDPVIHLAAWTEVEYRGEYTSDGMS